MAVYNAFGVNDDDAYDNDVNDADADVAPSSNTRSYSLRSVPSSPRPADSNFYHHMI